MLQQTLMGQQRNHSNNSNTVKSTTPNEPA